jgi:hypothetical protein
MIGSGAILATLLAQSAPASAPASRPAGPWLTELGEGVLARCDLVVLARVASATDLANGACVGVLRPERRLNPGPLPATAVVVGTRGEFQAAGASDPLELFLLARSGEGGRFALVGRIVPSDPAFAAKTSLAEETLGIAGLTDPAERLRRTRLLLHRGLAGEDPYLRANALVEFEGWGGKHPERFTADDLDRLRAIEGAAKDSAFRGRIGALLRRLTAPR